MVAIIHTSNAIARILQYNEQKVMQHKAICLLAEGFLKQTNDLSFSQKLRRLTQQAALNPNVKRNALHISLNFDCAENLSKERQAEIATTYMQKIGFGEQPYLVYQHRDAAHPHIHIVSINVKPDGKRINMHNIGKNQGMTARREIEEIFQLKKADDRNQKQTEIISPIDVTSITYGKTTTRKAITQVLNKVTSQYCYTSLPELNAVLRLYNVVADPGQKGSRIYRHHGLQYSILDSSGSKIGIPIKASDIHFKPTLSYLERKWETNKSTKPHLKTKTKTTLDWVILNNRPKDLETLISCLKNTGISTLLRSNPEGKVYGITFIDHRSRCVWNGSDLGKQYSFQNLAKNIHQQQSASPLTSQHTTPYEGESYHPDTLQKVRFTLPEDLLSPQKDHSYVSSALRKKKRKKRKITL